MVFPKEDFARCSLQDAGITRGAVAKTLRYIEENGKDIHSMLILKGGKIAFEHYFAPYTMNDLHAMFSCSKTFTSMLIGIAQGKGLLKLSDKVLPYFPEVTVKEPCSNKENMTVRDLLLMASGHGQDTYFGGMTEVEDWPDLYFNRPVEYTPGTHFEYNTGSTYMLSAILTKVTGKTALELAQEWIFDRIGIHDVWWEACPHGVSKGGTGLHVRPRDMARLGILISNEGNWEGEQIIPAEYIKEAREKQIDNRRYDDPNQDPNWAMGYGYQMWRCKFPAFRADGMGGQFIVMQPEKERIFVFTSGMGSDMGEPLNMIEDILLKDDGTDCSEEELAAMCRRLSAPEEMPRPDWALTFDFACKANRFGITRAALSEKELTIAFGAETAVIPYAWNKPVFSEQTALAKLPTAEDPSLTTFAARADIKTGLLRLQRFGSPYGYTVRPFAENGAVKVEVFDIMAGERAVLEQA